MARPRDELDMDVDRFEAMIDKSDPEQAALLAQIKEQTSRLRQARGNWNKPSAHRNWNSAKPPAETKPPLEDDSYRAYKQHLKEQQRQQALLLQQAPQQERPS